MSMFKNLIMRAKAQSIAYYAMSGNGLGSVDKRYFVDRSADEDKRFNIVCSQFVDKVCDNAYYYSSLNYKQKEILTEEFNFELLEIFQDLSLTYCELGMQIGFNIALDLGLDGYKERRGIFNAY